ncbi:MAG: hypothetical protein Fur0044_34220 [Anaerolineae bacterium]
MKKTTGDVFRLNITPPSTSFPWIRVFLHEYGIRKSGQEVGGVNAAKGRSRDEVARYIGEEIIRNSKILSAWFEDSKRHVQLYLTQTNPAKSNGERPNWRFNQTQTV